MSLDQLFEQFIGSQMTNAQNTQNANQEAPQQGIQQTATNLIGSLNSNMPGGALGGLAAGGLLGVLVGNKKMRKTVGKVAGGAVGLGGAAILGAVAFNAYKNWKSGEAPSGAAQTQAPQSQASTPSPVPQLPSQETAFDPVKIVGADGQPFQITLIKSMIAAAGADGHIDSDEQAKIFDAVNKLELEPADKALVFDTLQNPPTASDIAALSKGLEQSSEIYLASRLAIDPDNAQEHAYLTELVAKLGLPDDLIEHLEDQLRQQMI